MAGVLAAGSPAIAREVDRQEIAEDFAPDVPQERSVFCADTQVVTLTDGTEYRACTNWRARNRTRLVRTYAALDGPEIDEPANLATARDCFDLAVASANDPARLGFDEDLFLATARAEFTRCAVARNMQQTDSYSLSLYQRGVWLG